MVFVPLLMDGRVRFRSKTSLGRESVCVSALMYACADVCARVRNVAGLLPPNSLARFPVDSIMRGLDL